MSKQMQMPKSGHRSWFSSHRKLKNEGCVQTDFSRCQKYLSTNSN